MSVFQRRRLTSLRPMPAASPPPAASCVVSDAHHSYAAHHASRDAASWSLQHACVQHSPQSAQVPVASCAAETCFATHAGRGDQQRRAVCAVGVLGRHPAPVGPEHRQHDAPVRGAHQGRALRRVLGRQPAGGASEPPHFPCWDLPRAMGREGNGSSLRLLPVSCTEPCLSMLAVPGCLLPKPLLAVAIVSPRWVVAGCGI